MRKLHEKARTCSQIQRGHGEGGTGGKERQEWEERVPPLKVSLTGWPFYFNIIGEDDNHKIASFIKCLVSAS